MPKVSVIMGVYNTNNEIFLKEAIESILNQSFRNFEFIICDDGSIDNTYELISKFKEKDNRIKLIKNKENMGLAYTLNHCIEVAVGEYIARMDDDDYSYKDRLEKQVLFLDSNREYDIVSSAVDIYNGENIVNKQCVKYIKPEKRDFLWGSCFVHPATMFRKNKLEEVGGYRVAKETRRAEDYDLFMRMYAKGIKGFNFEESLLRYYVNTKSMKKRKYRYRVDETIVRYKGFKELKLLKKGIIFIFKPIIVGLIPNSLILKSQSILYK